MLYKHVVCALSFKVLGDTTCVAVGFSVYYAGRTPGRWSHYRFKRVVYTLNCLPGIPCAAGHSSSALLFRQRALRQVRLHPAAAGNVPLRRVRRRFRSANVHPGCVSLQRRVALIKYQCCTVARAGVVNYRGSQHGSFGGPSGGRSDDFGASNGGSVSLGWNSTLSSIEWRPRSTGCCCFRNYRGCGGARWGLASWWFAAG